ncbi:MAG: hypothetical protein IPJ32_21870 [Sphingobacteriaceae bacterium]|nr:hypothetical protein [Sphingobacteriaceae bacterium]
MWGLNLKYAETVPYNVENKTALLAKIESILKQNKCKGISVSNHVITAEKSTPFIYIFWWSESRTYLTIRLTDEGKLTLECSVPKGPGTDWGYCKKEVLKQIQLINS